MRKTLRLYEPYAPPVHNAKATSVSDGRIASMPQNPDDAMAYFSGTKSVGWINCVIASGTGATGPLGPTGATGPTGYGLSTDTVTQPGDTISIFSTTTLVASTGAGSIALPLGAANGAQKTLCYPVNFVAPSTTVTSTFLSGGTVYNNLVFNTESGVANLVFCAAINVWVVIDTLAVSLS